jgi:glycosyltransferase involved in cell wall biosynthesis
VAIIAGQLVVGGAERQLYLWLSHLDRNKFEPIVLTLHPDHHDQWEHPIEVLGIPLMRVHNHSNWFARAWHITQALRPYNPSLIHGWHMFPSPYAAVAAKLLGTRSLGSIRSAFGTSTQNYIESNLILGLNDAILANSKTAAERIRAVQKNKNQTIYTVQNAVEDPIGDDRLMIRRKLSEQFGLSPSSIWIGSLGRLDPGKRFDLLLKAMALLQEDVKDFRLLLIGDGPERLFLENLAEKLNIQDHVVFAGEVAGASSWLNALDIFCFTSLNEGLPNVVMEAAMAGVPIVSWRLPFMGELLNGDHGAFLAQPENLTEFKGFLCSLIHTPELRTKMGQVGRSHMLQNFTIDRYVQRMTDVYEDILRNH